jgi:hypothetical protein
MFTKLPVRLQLFGISLADPPRRDGGRPEETIWLTRFVVLLFAFWVGAYSLSKYQMNLVLHADEIRYLLPIYPVFVAACCYALAFLPGVVKWLAALPLLIAGFGGVCIALFSPLGALPGETWRELNAQRGDDYFFCLEDGRSSTWWDMPDGPEAAIRTLPRRWRDFAWITFGARMPTDSAVRWRRDPENFGDASLWRAPPSATREGVASPNIRELIAMGRGEAIGFDLCCSGRYEADKFPETAMEAPTARAFFVGVGYGCYQTSCGPPGSGCGFRFNFLPVDPAFDYFPEGTCNPAGASEALRSAQRRVGLSSQRSWEAFLEGVSMYLGATNQRIDAARRDKICRSWQSVFPAEPAEKCPASFRQGMADGYALALMNHFREVNVQPDPGKSQLGFAGSLADWPLVREALRRSGVDATPLDDAGRRFALRFAK